MKLSKAGAYGPTAVEIAGAVRRGEVSPVTVVGDCLARIDEVEPAVRAWVFVDRSGALEAARDLDAEARAGRFRGPLHGVPVALKDIFDAAGLVTTSGAAAFAHRRPAGDADAVAKLRGAGAIILGKTTTTEFAFSDPTVTRNPWNLEHTPGGSSSGSAAAVAARMAPLALGSQTIGSVLRPAAYCGVVGLKGTYGVINAAGITPLAWSLDHIGILALSVDDAALALSVLAPVRIGAHEAPPVSLPPRFGVPRGLFEGKATDEVNAHLDTVSAAFAQEGARIQDVASPPSAAELYGALRFVLRAEAAVYHAVQFAAHAFEYKPRIRAMVEAGLKVRAVDYVEAQQVRARFREEMAPIFASVDALLMPVAPAPAPKGLETTGDPVFCAPWSSGGFPAIALPSGLSRDGLPLAVQVIAGAHAEDRLLDVARWCEARLAFAGEPP